MDKRLIPKVSIIVPIYNTEKYLEKCINSILKQSFSDFELLLVDDGSTDNSGKICDVYASMDKRIITFHKENGGVSSARNVGLKHAKGEWITFVDSDDEIAVNYLECLYTTDEVDFVVADTELPDGTTLMPDPKPVTEILEINSHQAYLETQFSKMYFWIMASKLFKKRIIHENTLLFNSKLRISEDSCFIFQYLQYAKNIKFILCPIYFYNTNYEEQSRKYPLDPSQYQIHISYYLDILERLKKCFNYKFELTISTVKVAFRHFGFVYFCGINTYPDFKKCCKQFRKNKCIYYDNSKIKEKIETYAIYYFPRLVYLYLEKYR